jgi:cytochrome c biogenesis factor
VFVVFQGASNNMLTFNVKINPLIGFTWCGFALLLLGTALAAWPEGARKGSQQKGQPLTVA